MEKMHRIVTQYNVVIHLFKLRGARGLTTKFTDGYLVLIADWLSEKEAERTLMHELQHIVLGHLDERVDIEDDQKEQEVRTALKAMGY